MVIRKVDTKTRIKLDDIYSALERKGFLFSKVEVYNKLLEYYIRFDCSGSLHFDCFLDTIIYDKYCKLNNDEELIKNLKICLTI